MRTGHFWRYTAIPADTQTCLPKLDNTAGNQLLLTVYGQAGHSPIRAIPCDRQTLLTQPDMPDDHSDLETIR